MRKAVFLSAINLDESQFPLKMCKTRLVKYVPVATLALKLLPQLKRYVEEEKSFKSEPKIKSYETVKSDVSDPALVLKLVFSTALLLLLMDS